MILTFNESNSFFNAKELINSLNDICLELKHYSDISFEILPSINDDIKIKMLGIYLNGGIKRNLFQVKITANRQEDKLKRFLEKEYESIQSTISQIESYMKTEGLSCSYEFEYNYKFFTGQGRMGEQHNTLRKSKFEIEDLNPNHDRLKFSRTYKENPCRSITIKFDKNFNI